MYVAVLMLELFLPGSASLKDKRMVLNSIKDRVRHRFNVSVAEISDQDKWQRAGLGLALVSESQTHAEQELQKIFRVLDAGTDYEIVSHWMDYQKYGG